MPIATLPYPMLISRVLRDRELLSAEQIEQGLKLQQERGGALDTIILEEGWLPEALILEALGEAAGLTPIQLTEYEPNPALASAVSRDVSLHFDLIPLSMDAQHLHVACTRALSPEARSEMEMLLGRQLQAWIAPEVRIRDWQFSLYNVQPDARFLRLLNKLNFDDIDDEQDDEATVSASPVQMAAALANSITETGQDQDEEETKIVTLDGPEILLRSMGSRDELLGMLLKLGLEVFEFVAVFGIKEDAAVGWRAQSIRSSPLPLNHVAVALNLPSIFATARESKQPLLGPIPPDRANEEFLQQLGRIPPQVFLFPIEVRSKVVLFFYGDCGDRLIAPESLNKFLSVCQVLPEAFEGLVKARKPSVPSVPTSPPDYDALVERFLVPDSTSHSEVLEELLKAPEPAAIALIKRFPGPTPLRKLPLERLPSIEELGPIAAALIQLGPAAAKEIARLIQPEPQSAVPVRYWALLTAGYLAYSDVLEGLAVGMLDFEPAISAAARCASVALKNHLQIDPIIHYLRAQLENPDILIQALTIRGLGALRDRGAIENLVQRVQSADPLLAATSDQALQDITKARHPTWKHWVPWWELNRRVPPVEWLQQGLLSPDLEIRASSREELEWQGL